MLDLTNVSTIMHRALVDSLKELVISSISICIIIYFLPSSRWLGRHRVDRRRGVGIYHLRSHLYGSTIGECSRSHISIWFASEILSRRTTHDSKECTFRWSNFSPHGISSFVDKTGAILLYVISHPVNIVGGHTVEVFEYERESKQLIYRKTIVDPLFIRYVVWIQQKHCDCLLQSNNLVIIDRDRFYLTTTATIRQCSCIRLSYYFVYASARSSTMMDITATIVQSNLITPNGYTHSIDANSCSM